jgi:hypothetical protein
MRLLDVIRKIGQKPGMFLGDPDSSRYSIWHLSSFLCGYGCGSQPRAEGDDVLDEFNLWLCTRYRIQLSGAGWPGILIAKSGGREEVAFKTFFVLLEDYVSERDRFGKKEIEVRYEQMVSSLKGQ